MSAAVTRLAIVGPKHSGKSLLASYLVNGHGWTRLGHADPIKRGSAAMLSYFLQYDFPDMLKVRRNAGQGDVSGRITVAEIEANKSAFVPLLQWLGQWAREYLPAIGAAEGDIWIEHLRWRILAESHAHPDASIVVDDCRLPAEAAALRAQGFTILRLMRPEPERLASIRDDFLNKRPAGVSERDWWAEVARRMEAIGKHSTETDLEAIVPDLRVWCLSKDELGVVAERIAAGEDL